MKPIECVTEKIKQQLIIIEKEAKKQKRLQEIQSKSKQRKFI